MISTKIIAETDQNYNAKICMLGAEFHGPGYHSLVPAGTWAHSTIDGNWCIEKHKDVSIYHIRINNN